MPRKPPGSAGAAAPADAGSTRTGGFWHRGRRDEVSLHAGTFTSSCDRFSASPLVVPIAAQLGAPLTSVLGVLAAHNLAYGATQPLWGMLSDRVGRVRVLRGTLVLAAVASVLSAISPDLRWLLVARALTGAGSGGVIPTILVYAGDSRELVARHRLLAGLLGTNAAAAAAATAGSALLGAAGLWRAMFAVTGLLAAGTAIATRGLHEPARAAGHVATPLAAFRRALGSRVVWPVLVVALLEGGIVVGMVALLPTVAQASGASVAVGAVVATYGLGTLVGSVPARALAARTSPAALTAIGGVGVVGAHVLLVPFHTPLGVLVASGVLGLGWALLHPTVQAWATEALPEARAAVVALFVTSLFTASALTAVVLGPWVEQERFGWLFTVTSCVALGMVVLATFGRARFSRSLQDPFHDRRAG